MSVNLKGEEEMKAQPKQEEAQQQTELERIEGKIAEVTTRRETMVKAAAEASQFLARRQQILGGELLNSSDHQASLEFITSERIRIEGLEEAKKQATAQLAQLEAERDTINHALAIKAYEAKVNEAEEKLLAAFATLQELSATINGIVLDPPKGYATDYTKQVRNLFGHLHGMDFHAKLRDLTPRFPEYFQQVTK